MFPKTIVKKESFKQYNPVKLLKMKRSKNIVEPYNWGNNCMGWELVKNPALSVIEEQMPPNTSETKHYHSNSQQFFYILKGEATFDVNNQPHTVKEGEGIHILPKTVHQIKNNGSTTLEFLVISQPTSRGDRTDVN